MSYSPTTAVTAPIDVASLAKLLGHDGGDVKALCRADSINKWSKYKPVRYPDPVSSNNGKGEDGSYGLDYDCLECEVADLTNAAAGTNEWGYTRPNGGASAPYRMGDFRGYLHNAACPVEIAMANEIQEMGSSTYSITLRIDGEVGQWSDSYCIPVTSVLAPYSDYYLTAKIVQNDVVLHTYKSAYTWGSGNADARTIYLSGIDGIGLQYGEFHVDVFLANGNDAVSLEANNGISHRELTYKADTVVKNVSASLYNLQIYNQSHVVGTYMEYAIDNIAFNLVIPSIAEFYNRYYTQTSKWAKFKLQMYMEDAKYRGEYITHNWVDITDWNALDEVITSTDTYYQVYLGHWIDDAVEFYADYEEGAQTVHTYYVRLVMRIHDPVHLTNDKDYYLGTTEFDMPINGDDVEIDN